MITDDYSRYPVVEPVRSTSSKHVIPVMDRVFTMFGVPEVTMTLYDSIWLSVCTHGRVSGPSSLLDLRGHSPLRIQCPMSILTSGPETWPWGPVGWRRSSHDRVSRVPACESSPRAKLESDRYWWSLVLDYGTPERPWPTTMSMRSKA